MIKNRLLKCPWCGEYLIKHGGGDFPPIWKCDNVDCYETNNFYGSYEIWSALITYKTVYGRLDRAMAGISRILSLNTDNPATAVNQIMHRIIQTKGYK